MQELIYQHLQKSGLINEFNLSNIEIKKIATGTSHVYIVTVQQHPIYVIKIPLASLQKFINRENEYQTNQLLANLGISLPYYYFDFPSGTSITLYQANCQMLTPTMMQQEHIRKKVINLLKTVHQLPIPFLQNINLFSVIGMYRLQIEKQKDFLSEELCDLPIFDSFINELEKELSCYAIPSQPCHSDPSLENFLLVTDQLYLIDWEYAGNQDPCWDLATLIIYAEFNNEQAVDFLAEYFQKQPDEITLRRIQIYKVLTDYLWALWCLVVSHKQTAIARWRRFKASAHET